MNKIKFVNPLEKLHFFSVISLSHTWEVYRIRTPYQEAYTPNRYIMELVLPNQYLKGDAHAIKFVLEVEEIEGVTKCTYYDLCLFLYEELKRYKKPVLPLYWDRPSLIITDVKNIIVKKNVREVEVLRDHPWYSTYKELLMIDKRILEDLENKQN